MPPPAEGFSARLLLGPALRLQPDQRLVALVRDGYEAAFEEIVRRYGSPLTRYAAAIVGSRGEDVAQDAFSKALLALRRDGAEIELRPWLFRIVRNTALNDLRDNPPAPEVLADEIAGCRNPAEEAERREELADLIRRLRALPEPQRAAIVMRELEGLGHEEIAVALGVSGGAARQTIHRARTALRDGLGLAIPLPLLRLMLDGGGSQAAEAAASGVGTGIALKATTATVLVAGTLGAGLTLHGAGHGGVARSDGNTTRTEAKPAPTASAPLAATGEGAPNAWATNTGPPGNGRKTTDTGDGDPPRPARSTANDGANVDAGGPRPTRSAPGPGGGATPGARSGSGGSDSSGEDGGGSGSAEQSDDGADDGGSGESDDITGSEEDSGSNSGPGSGEEEGAADSESDAASDSEDGEGLSAEKQIQTEEEP